MTGSPETISGPLRGQWRDPMPRQKPRMRSSLEREPPYKVYRPWNGRTGKEWSPPVPCAFDVLTFGSSCDSRFFSRFASVFLDRRAE